MSLQIGANKGMDFCRMCHGSFMELEHLLARHGGSAGYPQSPSRWNTSTRHGGSAGYPLGFGTPRHGTVAEAQSCRKRERRGWAVLSPGGAGRGHDGVGRCRPPPRKVYARGWCRDTTLGEGATGVAGAGDPARAAAARTMARRARRDQRTEVGVDRWTVFSDRWIERMRLQFDLLC
jgi:hypothetical protein